MVRLALVAVFSCIYSTLVFISMLFRPKWLIEGFRKKSKFDQPPKCLTDESLGTHGYIHLEVSIDRCQGSMGVMVGRIYV